MSAMHNPPHPGEILADTLLRADGGMSVTAFAEKLKMTRAAISRVVNGKAGISPELSLRLEEALGTSAESWLAMQSARRRKPSSGAESGASLVRGESLTS
jgi:antitoxin HigA-1